MAIAKVKATYSLDVETVRALEATARRWQVSKSEVVRRAIRAVAEGKVPEEDDSPLAALDELQESLGLGSDEASAWQKRLSDERRAYSKQREPSAS